MSLILRSSGVIFHRIITGLQGVFSSKVDLRSAPVRLGISVFAALIISASASTDSGQIESEDRLEQQAIEAAPDPSVMLKAAEPEIFGSGDNVIAIYPCRFRAADDLRQAIMGLVSMEGTVELGTNLNSLIISEEESRARLLIELLERLDKPRHQLLVEARVIEITVSRDFEAEIRHLFQTDSNSFIQSAEVALDTPGSGALSTQGILLNLLPVSNADGKSLDTFVRLLMERGDGRILSSPNVLVTEGTQAFIHTGEELPIFSTTVSGSAVQVTNEFKSVGVKLRVRPIRVSGDMVEMEIMPEVSAVTGFRTGPQGASAPVVAQRQIQATLRVYDGQIITIGGLLQEENRRTIRKIPLLGDIPILGALFQGRRNEDGQTHLVFLLRVNVLPEGEAHTARVHRPGAGLDSYDELTFGLESNLKKHSD